MPESPSRRAPAAPPPAADLLARAGWAGARRAALAGDASTRRYARLHSDDGATAILMERGGDTAPFLRAARHLAGLGFSTPAILAAEGDAILMEDLGDADLARLARDPAREEALYALATDALIALHRHPAPVWAAPYGPAEMAAALEPFWTHHARGADPATRAGIEARLRDLLAAHDAAPVLLHRDYHAQNLLHLPDRPGVAALGLLDFQDACAGHPAYDLGSLLQDARRDVAPALEARMIDRYAAATGQGRDAFAAAYTLQALQRHLRILGIFARLAAEGRSGYLTLVPRVGAHAARCLAQPVAAPLSGLRALLPAEAPAR